MNPTVDHGVPCRLCTVPTTDGAALCTFCRDYAGDPVDSLTRGCCGGVGGHAGGCASSALESAAAETVEIRADVAAAMRALSKDSPLWAAVDLVQAMGHLREARRAIERALLTIAAEAVR